MSFQNTNQIEHIAEATNNYYDNFVEQLPGIGFGLLLIILGVLIVRLSVIS